MQYELQYVWQNTSHITRVTNIAQYKSFLTNTHLYKFALAPNISKMQTLCKPWTSPAQNFQTLFARISADAHAYVYGKENSGWNSFTNSVSWHLSELFTYAHTWVYVINIRGLFPCVLVKVCAFRSAKQNTFYIPYPTAFPYGNGMVLHFYQQQESSTTKTVHKVINKGLKAYV